MAKARKVVITCAVTGAIHTPSMSPHLPVTAQEIADAAIGAAEAGAAIVHLHARNPQDGRPDQSPEAFAPPLFIQSVFGILGGIGTHPEDVMQMKRTADRLFGNDYRWSVLGAGRSQMQIAAMAAAMGGNVRVGLEDSIWIGPGELAKSNAEQVRKVREIINGLGLDVASADEARALLALKGGDKVAF
jgi:uncharacterized protein (DUF849 family)